MNPPPFTITNDSITIVWNGKPHTFQKGDMNFENLRRVLFEGKWDEIEDHLEPSRSVASWSDGLFTSVNGRLHYEGDELPKELSDRIMSIASSGKDPRPLFNFWKRLQENPSWRSVKQLYGFFRNDGITITPDGHILAYKSVRDNFLDHYSGKFNNRPGTKNKMPRNKISDDPNKPCHEGFHVGALSYARSFGGGNRRIVICKLDPKDVVCVPYDSSQQKVRVCEYTVVGVHNGRILPDILHEEDLKDFFPDFESMKVTEVKIEVDGNGDPVESVVETVETVTQMELLGGGEDAEDASDEEAVAEVKDLEAPEGVDLEGIHRMGPEDLYGQSLRDLRKYARHKLKIIGASKIPGGKTVLINLIMKSR